MAEAAADSRLEVVDIVRGFALSGLFLVHMLEIFELYWVKPEPGIADWVFLLLMGKSFSLLALCFGFSFFILMDRAAKRGSDFTWRFAWRLLILEAIGFLHALVYRGDIIQLLAGMGFLLLIAHRVRSNRALLIAAGFCFLAPSLLFQLLAAMAGAEWANAAPHFWQDGAGTTYLTGDWIETLRVNLWAGQQQKWWFMLESGRVVQIMGLYLLGMVLGRTGFFARLGEFAKVRGIVLAVAAIAALAIYLGRDAVVAGFDGEGPKRLANAILTSWLELSGTAIWALLLLAVYQGAGRWLIHPFAAMGRLTLTLYIAQSLVFVPIFYGFGLGLWDDWSQGTRLFVGLAALAFQFVFAAAWLRRFHYGPIEWLWRALTYWRRDIPFRR